MNRMRKGIFWIVGIFTCLGTLFPQKMNSQIHQEKTLVIMEIRDTEGRSQMASFEKLMILDENSKELTTIYANQIHILNAHNLKNRFTVRYEVAFYLPKEIVEEGFVAIPVFGKLVNKAGGGNALEWVSSPGVENRFQSTLTIPISSNIPESHFLLVPTYSFDTNKETCYAKLRRKMRDEPDSDMNDLLLTMYSVYGTTENSVTMEKLFPFVILCGTHEHNIQFQKFNPSSGLTLEKISFKF